MKSQNEKRIEKDMRSPDMIRHEMIFSENEDHELLEIIKQSRIQYLEETTKREQLKLEFAIPLARLKLWQNNSTNEQEIYFLQLISELSDCITEQTIPNIPPKMLIPFKNFLYNLEKSKLYNNLSKYCLKLLK